MKRCAIYLRVSTTMQSVASQRLDLEAFTKSREWHVVEVYSDEAVSGMRERRPALDRLMADARRRRFDVVLVWRFDRFARSTRFLVEALETFRTLGIDFVSYQEALDTSTPMGNCMFLIISALARLERDVLAERVRAGLRRAKLEGRRLGRRPLEVDPRRLQSVVSRKLSARAAAKELGCSTASAWRLIRAHTMGAPDAGGASRATEEVRSFA